MCILKMRAAPRERERESTLTDHRLLKASKSELPTVDVLVVIHSLLLLLSACTSTVAGRSWS